MNPVTIYNEAIKRVPAYRNFLIQKVGEVPTVETEEDFNNLPLMTKSSYALQHPLSELCMDGDPSCAHLWLRSSGTSGNPFYWPRRYEDEKDFPKAIKRLFHDYVSPDNQPTLVVVGLALGPWGTGIQTSFVFRYLAREIPGLAVVSPGLQTDTIIEILERLSPQYKQTLLLSYPPYAKNVLEEAANRGLDLPALNIHAMVGGEGITESYRERMWKLLGHDEKNLNSVWCLYGSTDFGNVGFENPLTIATRRILAENNLCNDILGLPELPMLFQRVPGTTHFEDVDGELVVSRLQGIPLIRYQSGDHIKFIPREELLGQLRDAGFDAEQAVLDAGLPIPKWETPFIALYGRIDQTVFFYGCNIMLEQVKTALDCEALAIYFDGRFLLKTEDDAHGNPQIVISLPNTEELQVADLDHLADLFTKELRSIHAEFYEVTKLTPNLRHVLFVTAPDSAFELGWKTRHM